jgi:hypothetical protein
MEPKTLPQSTFDNRHRSQELKHLKFLNAKLFNTMQDYGSKQLMQKTIEKKAKRSIVREQKRKIKLLHRYI